MAEAGWLGVAMPEEYGGSGLGITEAAIVMQAVAQSGAGFSGASAVHMNIFGLHPVVVFGTDEQKQRFLPPLIAGKEKACFAVTEPDVGLDTTRLKTRAVRDGNGYVITGRKIWTSTAPGRREDADPDPHDAVRGSAAPVAGHDAVLHRPRPQRRSRCARSTRWAAHAVDSNMVFIDGLKVPPEDRIGEEGKGFQYILHGMNPERILIAAEAVGLGRAALARAARYAGERIVFGRPIGQNQGIQHPLAERWIELEAAELLVLRAAAAYDRGDDAGTVGAYANAAKYFAAEAGHRACETAVLTHGGMGYAARIPRRALLPRNPDRPHRPGQPAADPVAHRRARARLAEIVLSFSLTRRRGGSGPNPRSRAPGPARSGSRSRRSRHRRARRCGPSARARSRRRSSAGSDRR